MCLLSVWQKFMCNVSDMPQLQEHSFLPVDALSLKSALEERLPNISNES